MLYGNPFCKADISPYIFIYLNKLELAYKLYQDIIWCVGVISNRDE